MAFSFSRAQFPDDFLFGTATSSYQIEGHSFGKAGPTHWDTFAATPGNVAGAQNGAIACDHYHMWEQDLDLMADAGFDVYRFSTSWARILPEGKGAVNHQGLDFYDRLIDGMLQRNLKPAATLYHWELPAALADLGGWRNRDIANWFADYTQIVMDRLGDRIWSAAPINEPWCVGWLSHFMGIHAPGLRDIRATAHAMHHILKCHGKAVEVMRALGMKNLGAVCNFEWPEAGDNTAQSRHAAKVFDGHYNRFFMDGLFKGSYPQVIIDEFEPHMPKNWQDDFALITQPLDWLGLNYYTRKLVLADPHSAWPSLKDAQATLPTTDMGWEIYPEGLYKFLRRTCDEYTGELPLYITENGMAHHDKISNNICDDPQRIRYFDAHLNQVLKAANEGMPIKGYFAWSLMDNYEWAVGYEKRFGLVHVDFNSLKRTPKSSYYAFQSLLNNQT